MNIVAAVIAKDLEEAKELLADYNNDIANEHYILFYRKNAKEILNQIDPSIQCDTLEEYWERCIDLLDLNMFDADGNSITWQNPNGKWDLCAFNSADILSVYGTLTPTIEEVMNKPANLDALVTPNGEWHSNTDYESWEHAVKDLCSPHIGTDYSAYIVNCSYV